MSEHSKVLKIAEIVAEKEGFPNCQIELEGGNEKGEGYLAEISFVRITDKSTKETKQIVIKKAFTEEKIRAFAPIKDYFKNEIYFYNTVWPTLDKFQKERGLLKPFAAIPKIYYSSEEDLEETLVLENLKAEGFEMFDKKKELDEEHIKFIFDLYAKFHALSFAYKELYPEENDSLCSKVPDLYSEVFGGDVLKQFIKKACSSAYEAVEGKVSQEILDAFANYKERGDEEFMKALAYTGKHGTVIHGDCWSNNMIFKYSGGKLTEMKLLDFQLFRMGSPAHDLSYCLYSGASMEVIKKLDDLLLFYHEKLTKCLKELGVDSAKVYPFSILKQEWLKYAVFGFVTSLSIRKMKLTVKEDLLDLKDIDDFENMDDLNKKFDKVSVEDRYYTIIKELFEHFYNYGIIGSSK